MNQTTLADMLSKVERDMQVQEEEPTAPAGKMIETPDTYGKKKAKKIAGQSEYMRYADNCAQYLERMIKESEDRIAQFKDKAQKTSELIRQHFKELEEYQNKLYSMTAESLQVLDDTLKKFESGE